jgi:hypothetical protein
MRSHYMAQLWPEDMPVITGDLLADGAARVQSGAIGSAVLPARAGYVSAQFTISFIGATQVELDDILAAMNAPFVRQKAEAEEKRSACNGEERSEAVAS